jgi:hypothetical protein
MFDRERRFAKAFTSKTPPPALLHVYRESRFESLSAYHPHFKTDASPIYIYMPFSQDTSRCADNILEYIGDEEVRSIWRLTLEVGTQSILGIFIWMWSSG